jgi:hypothetical protein
MRRSSAKSHTQHAQLDRDTRALHTVHVLGDLEQPVRDLLEEELAEERHPSRPPLPPRPPAPPLRRPRRCSYASRGHRSGRQLHEGEAPAAAGELGAAAPGIRVPPRATTARWWGSVLRRPRSRHRGMGTPLPLLTAAAFASRFSFNSPLFSFLALPTASPSFYCYDLVFFKSFLNFYIPRGRIHFGRRRECSLDAVKAACSATMGPKLYNVIWVPPC